MFWKETLDFRFGMSPYIVSYNPSSLKILWLHVLHLGGSVSIFFKEYLIRHTPVPGDLWEYVRDCSRGFYCLLVKCRWERKWEDCAAGSQCFVLFPLAALATSSTRSSVKFEAACGCLDSILSVLVISYSLPCSIFSLSFLWPLLLILLYLAS